MLGSSTVSSAGLAPGRSGSSSPVDVLIATVMPEEREARTTAFDEYPFCTPTATTRLSIRAAEALVLIGLGRRIDGC